MPLQNIIKLFQTIKKLLSAQEFDIEIYSGEITRKRTKQELSFLHVTILLDQIYVPTKLSHTLWELWAAQEFSFRGRKYIMNKELCLLYITCLMVLIYVCTKYYQNISNHQELWNAQEFRLEAHSGE